MAIVVYKCDVCKREKEYIRNVEGLERIQRCTITHGCRGKLYQIAVYPDYSRASAPERVVGLNDWKQRKVLYNHEQSIARDEWIITHGLGTFPSVSVYVNIPIEGNLDNIEEIFPQDIEVIDDNTIKLVFDKPWAGLAQLIARQSDPDLLKPYERTQVQEEELIRISNGGEISLVSRISTVGTCDIIKIHVTYTTTQNTVIKKIYELPLNYLVLSSSSAWKDFDKVIIRGKTYDIRILNGIYDAMYDQTIGNGSTMVFDKIEICSATSERDLMQDEIYVLFANEPYATVDKVTDKYIDLYDTIQNQFSIVYDSGEFFAKSGIIQQIYPPIRPIIK